MRYLFRITGAFLLFCLSLQAVQGQGHDGTELTVPTIAGLAAHFRNPPPEYGPTVTWGWQGAVDTSVINRDLDQLKALGFRMVTIEGGHMPQPYLSEGYFKRIRYAVQAAKKRNMRVWIIDEGKYPSGFAGGLFTKERPDLRMQALLPHRGGTVAAAQQLTEKVPAGTLAAIAVNGDSSVALQIRHGRVDWQAPRGEGDWRILYAVHAFRTSPTRSSNNPTGAKDQSNSLCDYLNPKATAQFIAFTHAQYKKYIGDEFGRTVMGFRSDEPAYSYTPWTPDMLQEFKKQKGYDIRPYLPSFFLRHPTEKQKLAKADYQEVFSNLFRDHFFKVISDWCVANHLEYEDHLDHDGPEDNKTMLELGRSEGDFFRDMRYLQIPGIDVIWHQLWPGIPNDFPKLASSAAHLFGRPQVFSESFAAFRPAPDISQVKWILNEQMVRGINLFEIMFYPSSTGRWRGPHGFMASDSFPGVMRATSRKAYVLANGRPAAKIGVYFPTSALWLRDTVPNTSTWHIARQLLEQQRDFDFVDYQSLASLMTLKKGKFINLSGQQYSAILVPRMHIISGKVLQRLHDFAAQGGRVIFMGQAPSLVRRKSFLDETPIPAHDWAVTDTAGDIGGILPLLPDPDVRFTRACAAIKYTHRHLKDGELYFFFNESDSAEARTVVLQGNGDGLVQVWNPHSGEIVPMGGCRIGKGQVTIPLDLAPHESRIIVVGKLPEKFLPAYYRTHAHPRFTDYLPGDTVNRLPPGPFKASWPSLTQNYQVPRWFKDAKFGIFIHWGLYAIPAHHNEWYARHMYHRGGIANWHVAHYGRQDTFGYKDFIPLFHASKFNPGQWAALFKEAGAKYVVPVAEHHDGFKMYASDLTVWDAADMGPRRDLVGELAAAVRKEGLVFGVSDHEIENWSFMYPDLKTPMDIFDPENAGFYGPPQPPDSVETQAFLNQWLAIAEELVDKYHPRLFYFDNGVDSSRLDSMKQRFGAYYYNRAKDWNKGPVICTKFYAYPDAAGVHEYEKQGRSPRTIQPDFWQTDDVISNFSWGYVSDMRYRSPGSILHELIDNVSKNGALLLNISPRGDGSIPEAQQQILRSIGGWLKTNGGAIYGSRPWIRFGEGPSADTTVNLGRYHYTGRDFRFTRKGDTLYAIAMAWPGKEALITSLARGAAKGRISQVTLLGSPAPVSFRQTRKGLVLRLPAEKPNDYAYVFRITGLKLNQDDPKNK